MSTDYASPFKDLSYEEFRNHDPEWQKMVYDTIIGAFDVVQGLYGYDNTQGEMLMKYMRARFEDETICPKCGHQHLCGDVGVAFGALKEPNKEPRSI